MFSILQDRLWTLEGSIEQRLKWAAGANPGLADVLHEFEASLEHRRSLLQQERERMLQTLSLCGTLLHFEALRTRTSDSIALDKGGFDILQRCRQGWAPGSTLLSTLELRLLQRLDSLGGGVLGASDWMELVRNHLNNLQTAMVARREDVGRQVEATLDRLQQLVDEMKAALVRHNHMLSSLKSLLKAMAKDEGAGENVLVEGRVRDWLAQHRDWQESTQDVLHRVNKAIEKPSGHDQTAILQAAGSFLQKLSPMTRRYFRFCLALITVGEMSLISEVVLFLYITLFTHYMLDKDIQMYLCFHMNYNF
uniref:Uncharacterized protein n=1 Tax=Eptatretus burgeri TaxID=7764 RepID=A0A8C4WUW2_EPTBU